MNGFVPKPIDKWELIRALAQHLPQQPPPQPALQPPPEPADAAPPAAPTDAIHADATLQSVLQRLRPLLVEGELPPDALIEELAAQLSIQPALQAPIMRLMQRLEHFDHPGALRLIDALLPAATPTSPPRPFDV